MSRSDWKSDHPGMRSPSASRLLTADELALRWQVPVGHVYRLTRRGDLTAVELGRYRRYSLAAVEEFEIRGGTGASTTT